MRINIPVPCVKSVLDTEEGVCCDDACERWFHREYLKMSKAEYQHISGYNKHRWEWSRTDCQIAVAVPVASKLDAILDKLSSLTTKAELTEGLKSIKRKFLP